MSDQGKIQALRLKAQEHQAQAQRSQLEVVKAERMSDVERIDAEIKKQDQLIQEAMQALEQHNVKLKG